MYEQVSHTALNKILDDLKPKFQESDLRFFYSRLGANFYAIHSLFQKLYGSRPDFDQQLTSLVTVLVNKYIERPSKFKTKDIAREADHNWFLEPKWVGMALYANGFADNLEDLSKRLNYFTELGVNLVHILPILACPTGKSDGGYAVSDFRKVDARLGSNDDLTAVIKGLHERDALIALDIVVNHTSDEHPWAQSAQAGEQKYQDYFYTFNNRDIPDMFEQSMKEVFPETDPGNFTFNEAMNKWVMTVFHDYQWDLNYSNPEVFIEMLDIILYWANQGIDVLRLDAVAFLWKKIGSVCQNEREAHLVLQLFKDCCQVVAPGLLFIAEAIVAPSEVVKYFGEDAVVAKECDIAYNATLMALLWDSVATKNAKLLKQGLNSIPAKLDGATWLNYLRCHDDIGFGFEDRDIHDVGFDPSGHRKFLLDYFTGGFQDSAARGRPFGINDKNGDARISGSLASLIGLEKFAQDNDAKNVDRCIQHNLLLNSIIMSFGGIPLLYYGDEVGVLNDYRYEQDEQKSSDSRWLHRPKLNWQQLEKRHDVGTLEHKLFSSLQRMIALRKETPAFADFNNRELLPIEHDAIIGYLRFAPQNPSQNVIVIANMSSDPQRIALEQLQQNRYFLCQQWLDLWTGCEPEVFSDHLVLGGFQFYWLVQR